ncbi:MAG TPA: FAD-dependent oxidoreductase, partial [Armatimonadota bacterium]|nr:FAD-dependent oxidoreductase [Armatimonadota bacterium]
MARVGVFVCWCGSNIAKTVDVEKVAEAASKMPSVAYATHYKYMCSEPGQNLVKQAIEEHKLTRIVVASCSPRLHEPTFQRCISEAGLNPYMLEMANIREHCSWVHEDKEAATQKAIDLTAMAVAKAVRNEALFQQEIPLTKTALVIGGGVAGIQAALDIADAGYKVTLVERTPSIGGRMAQYDKTFPTLDCAACILTPKMVDCASNPNIR